MRRVSEVRKPSIPWRRVLHQFTTRVFGGGRRWLPPSRRHVHRGLYLPSLRQETVRLVVALDTSASTQWEMGQLLGELVGVIASFGRYEITVLQCDYELQAIDVYTPERPLALNSDGGIDVLGGGGTSFVPVFDWVAEHPAPDALIYLTDGFGEVPAKAPRYPVLWALCGDGERPVDWGEQLRLPAAPNG